MTGYFTGAIALLAVVIAWAQWHTARSKLVLDLFNERIKIYADLIAALEPVVVNGRPTVENIADFSTAADRARFLFGDDVNKYLREMRTTLTKVGLAVDEIQMNMPDAPREKRIAMTRVIAFPEDFGKLATPYMRMDQKLPPWPFGRRAS